MRKRIEPKKGGPRAWLDVHREAHRQGFKSTATMMYGHVETPEDIVDHWESIRDLQDEHGGFTAFVPWSFKPGNTLLEKWIKTYQGPNAYLRMLAPAPYSTTSPSGLVVLRRQAGGAGCLHWGADDFGDPLRRECPRRADFVNKTTVTIDSHPRSGLHPGSADDGVRDHQGLLMAPGRWPLPSGERRNFRSGRRGGAWGSASSSGPAHRGARGRPCRRDPVASCSRSRT